MPAHTPRAVAPVPDVPRTTKLQREPPPRLYAKDCGRAIDVCATIDAPSENVFNIAYPVTTSFEELVALIKDQLPNLRLDIVPGKPPLNRAAPLDINRAKEMLGWEPEFSMQDAFADYIADLKVQLER